MVIAIIVSHISTTYQSHGDVTKATQQVMCSNSVQIVGCKHVNCTTKVTRVDNEKFKTQLSTPSKILKPVFSTGFF